MESQDTNQISEAINYFGLNLFEELLKEDTNVFFSPFSISCALAIAFVGSSHETAEEMSHVLGYERAKLDSENLKSDFQRLFSKVNKSPPNTCTLNTGNTVIIDDTISIHESYSNVIRDFFQALVVSVDFANDTTAVVERVNEWIKTQTNDIISHLIDSLDSTTKVIILNAIYFKGLWLHAFKEKSTFLQYFYNNGLGDEPKLVEMMHLKEKFLMAEDNSYRALQLPYINENLAMLFLLPNSRNGLGEFEKQLSIEFLKNIKENLRLIEVEVALPKLHLEYKKSLTNSFQNLGMKRAFAAGANFDKMGKNENLYISEVIHKAVLDVTEEGTEAAAATAVKMNRYCLTHCPEFIIDHPFLFLIMDSKNDLILFIGKVAEL